MRKQQSGSIINISSVAAISTNYPTVAYKTTKAGMVAFTEQLAQQNAEFGVRANSILPGLMNTPMAVDTRVREWGTPRAEVEAARHARVPLRRRMGTGWDVASAALFLASDEANFITGVGLLVDGGGSLRKEGWTGPPSSLAPALSHAEKALAEVRANTFSQASGRASIGVTRGRWRKRYGSRDDPQSEAAGGEGARHGARGDHAARGSVRGRGPQGRRL